MLLTSVEGVRRDLSLRELANEWEAIELALEQNEGVATPEIEAWMEKLSEALRTKTDGVADYLRSLDEEADRIEREEERLKSRRMDVKARRERFANYVLAQMQRLGEKKLAGAFNTLQRDKLPDVVLVEDEAALPEEWWRVTVPEPKRSPDKVRLAVELKAGKEIPGVRLQTGREKLSLK